LTPAWLIALVQLSLIGCASARAVPNGNDELFRLCQDDQADRSGSVRSGINWAEVGARDAQRRKRVKEILDSDGAKVAADYLHAAVVFQHGSQVRDYRLAHDLALRAVELDPGSTEARWLAAASKDRELMTLGKPQLYGTQFRKEGERWVLYRVDPAVTDEERAKWNVPTLEAAKARAEEMNAAK